MDDGRCNTYRRLRCKYTEILIKSFIKMIHNEREEEENKQIKYRPFKKELFYIV